MHALNKLSLELCDISLPLVDTCTHQTLKSSHSPSKYAMNTRDAEIQKLQGYSNQIEKML
jgi:hypothetical protein